jgi:sterol carrier protein 2
MAKKRVFVIGVGMTKFEKPGRRDWDYPDMAKIAGERALEDACISYKEIQQACVGYCYGDSTCGQRAVYEMGMSGIPIYNVNNNCATGSTALFMAKQFIEGGISDCCMALGFEKMEKGSLGAKYFDRTNPMDKHMGLMMEVREFTAAPPAPQMFGNAGLEHMEKFGTTNEHFAKIAVKNHRNSANNPYSQFRDIYSLEQIQGARQVYGPLTKLQCCPTSDGAGCAILANEDFVRKNGLEGQAVEIIGMSMATDLPSTFGEKSCIKMVGFDMTNSAAQQAYKMAGVSPQDVDVIELHDCFSANELITYEGLGLCKRGEAGKFIDQGDNDYGGNGAVVNPSGGLISKGHPLGATGLAQCAEMCWQLRGEAGTRQVKQAKVALSHNLGLGGAAVVTIYKRPEEWKSKSMKRKVSLGMGPPAGVAAAGVSAKMKAKL